MLINTLGASSDLQQAGVSKPQAQAIAKLVFEVFSQAATKDEVKGNFIQLDAKINTNYERLDAKINANYKRLDDKLNRLDAKIDDKFNQLRTEMKSNMAWLRWLGFQIALVIAFGAFVIIKLA